MMPYPDDWELDRTFTSIGSVDLFECEFCYAVVVDRKQHYFWHFPESKEARRG